MTKFNRKDFNYHGGYLTYKNEFIARFKYCPKDKSAFLTFLIKNFTPSEYFNLLKNSTPVQVMETKGYISTTIKNLLKDNGYPLTLDGYKDFLKNI